MLEWKNMDAGYGARTVLHDVSLQVKRGELLSLIGPNGCGKSTLLKTAVGILPIRSGELLVSGQRQSDLSRGALARRVAYLAQGKETPDMTVRQMVLHGRFPYLRYPRRYTEADRSIASKAIEQMGLSEYTDAPMSTLSGGMRQHAYLAMALTQQSEVLLLDEPTTYLDVAHQLDLMKTLRRLADEGHAVAIVMHDLPLAFAYSDKIAVMREGSVVAVDTPNVICSSGLVEQIFGVALNATDGRYAYRY